MVSVCGIRPVMISLLRADLVRVVACLGQLEARLTEERAELVASNGLLDQNERLRAAIVAEEREKFQSEKVRLCMLCHALTLRTHMYHVQIDQNFMQLRRRAGRSSLSALRCLLAKLCTKSCSLLYSYMS